MKKEDLLPEEPKEPEEPKTEPEPIFEEEMTPIYKEEQLGQMILKVWSRLARKKVGDKWQETGYTEILTPDVTSAFLTDGSLAVLRNIEELLAMIYSFHGAYEVNMQEAFNFIALYHNSLVVSSKATGKGAKVAKSQYVEQKYSGRYWDERRKRGKLESALEKMMGRREME